MAFVRTKIIKGRPYLYLVENPRIDGRTRQKVLKYLGPETPVSESCETATQVIGL